MSETAEPIARRRLSDEDRCRLLREAAAEVFLRDGYAAAHMDEVARGAGMSKRTLYQHYPSKAALFEAVMDDGLAPFHLDMALEHHPDLATALRGMLEAGHAPNWRARLKGRWKLLRAALRGGI